VHPLRYKERLGPVVYFVVITRDVFSHGSRYILLWSICGSFLFSENPKKITGL
jgi:hypothetical protein